MAIERDLGIAEVTRIDGAAISRRISGHPWCRDCRSVIVHLRNKYRQQNSHAANAFNNRLSCEAIIDVGVSFGCVVVMTLMDLVVGGGMIVVCLQSHCEVCWQEAKVATGAGGVIFRRCS
jgi:hypothetical protein